MKQLVAYTILAVEKNSCKAAKPYGSPCAIAATTSEASHLPAVFQSFMASHHLLIIDMSVHVSWRLSQSIHLCQLKAMAVSQTVIEEVRATIGGPDGIYHKIEKVLAILETNGWAQKMTIQPKDMLCHPANRGGSMLSFHDVWSKGQAMLSVGLQKKLLHGSIAMELSKDPTKRADQIKKNHQVVKDANGHLAPVTGQERFLLAWQVVSMYHVFCFSNLTSHAPRFLIIVQQPHCGLPESHGGRTSRPRWTPS